MKRRLVAFLSAVFLTASVSAGGDPSAFGAVYTILKNRCGHCHQVGGASSWVTDMPPTEQRFPHCTDAPNPLMCSTHAQLTEAPGEEIPAWIRPHEAAMSEPYQQACNLSVSFHIGVSLPQVLPPEECSLFLDWITAGANL